MTVLDDSKTTAPADTSAPRSAARLSRSRRHRLRRYAPLLVLPAAVALCGFIGPILLFQNAINTGVGTRPSSSAVGDVNGDGIPDLVTANAGDGTVSILIGNGNGTFQPQRIAMVGSNPRSIALSDLNGDGKLDIVTVNADDNTISLLRGVGNGTFQPQTILPAGGAPDGIAVGDVNGDGKPDLVVANAGGNSVSVWIGSGNGSFQTPILLPVGSQPYSVTLADLNGDGKLDIVTPNFGDGTVSVLLNNGDGTFAPAASLPTVANPQVIAIANINGDSKPDLLVGNATYLTERFGNGDGTFQDQMGVDFISESGIAVADLNGDGLNDLFIANPDRNEVFLYRGFGDGSYYTQHNVPTGAGSSALLLADLNGDGQPDLITTNGGSNSISVLLNNNGGANVTPQFAITAGTPQRGTGTTLYTQRVVLKNTGANTFRGSLFLALDNLASGVTLANANGTTQFIEPLNSPYVRVYPPNNGLAPGGIVTVTLQFRNPSNRAISYTPRVLAGGVQP